MVLRRVVPVDVGHRPTRGQTFPNLLQAKGAPVFYSFYFTLYYELRITLKRLYRCTHKIDQNGFGINLDTLCGILGFGATPIPSLCRNNKGGKRS